jgi:hypothetical protein
MPPSYIEIDAFMHQIIEKKTYDKPVRIIYDPKSENLLTPNKKTYYSLKFKNCIFNSEVTISAPKTLRKKPDLSFDGCFIDSISLALITYPLGLSFFSCYIQHFTCDQEPKLNIDLTNSLGNFFLNNLGRLNVVYAKESIFARTWVTIYKKVENIFELKTSYNVSDTLNINFQSNIFQNTDEIQNGLVIRSNDKVKESRLLYSPSEFEMNLLNINIKLNYNSSSKTPTVIQNYNLETLSIMGEPKGEIKIENSKINEIYFHNLSIQDSFKLYQIEPIKEKGKFEVHQCNLKNTWFDNIQLNKYSLVFFKSSLSDIQFTSTTFPKIDANFKDFQSLANIHQPDMKKDFYYKDQYEIFLQLRIALLKTGNIYEAQKMKSIAYNALKKVKDVDLTDKIILRLNRFTNNHGISPFKALKHILITSILLYLFYLNSLDLLTFGDSIDWNLVANYFSFLDITHRNTFLVSSEALNPSSIFLDFLNKIVLGYFIYQFISGFRKFGK